MRRPGHVGRRGSSLPDLSVRAPEVARERADRAVPAPRLPFSDAASGPHRCPRASARVPKPRTSLSVHYAGASAADRAHSLSLYFSLYFSLSTFLSLLLSLLLSHSQSTPFSLSLTAVVTRRLASTVPCAVHYCGNDPYAGSPTKTLLRLLLPRSDQVRLTFRSLRRDGREAAWRSSQSVSLTKPLNR